MKKNKEKDSNLCSCIYDVLINENEQCMLELDGKRFKPKNLDYIKRLSEEYLDTSYEECISDVYSRVCLLTNEHLNIDDDIYFRVFRILFTSDIFLDLNKLRKLTNISVWSNVKDDINLSVFLIYWKGKKIGYYDCPPATSTIIDTINSACDVISSDNVKPDFLELVQKIYNCEKEIHI